MDQFSGMGPWIFLAAVIVGVIVINQLLRWLLAMRLRHLEPAKHMWRHALLSAASAPVRALIWLLGLLLVKQELLPAGTGPRIIHQAFNHLPGILFALLLAWFLLRLVSRVQDNYLLRAQSAEEVIDRTAVDAIGKLIWAVIVVFTIISILQQVGVSLASLLAFGGAAGIAVGFAAQNLVANLFGGLTIYASRIFKIGEDIVFPGSNLAGTVQQIGWRSTRLLGWDGKPFYVPNSIFNTSNMINHSRLTHRAISEHILLRYQNVDKVRAVVNEGNDLLRQRTDLSYYMFHFDGFGDNAVKLYIYAWVQTEAGGDFLPYTDFMRVKEEILLSIVDIARKHGCDLTLPVSNLYLHEGDKSKLPDALLDSSLSSPRAPQGADGKQPE